MTNSGSFFAVAGACCTRFDFITQMPDSRNVHPAVLQVASRAARCGRRGLLLPSRLPWNPTEIPLFSTKTPFWGNLFLASMSTCRGVMASCHERYSKPNEHYEAAKIACSVWVAAPTHTVPFPLLVRRRVTCQPLSDISWAPVFWLEAF